jgi:hypothetical protein
MKVESMRHPEWRENVQDWKRWRLAYEGGRSFVTAYLKQYSKREDNSEFQARKEMTYCPRFAGAAIDDVKNSIYQRMTDIARIGGDSSYQLAVAGKNGGVDLEGSNMNRFVGQFVLRELLVTSKIGVYVDMPSDVGPTIASNRGKRPYLYYYCAEDITDWCYDYDGCEKFFTSLLLREQEVEYEPVTGLAKGAKTVWRHYRLVEDGVYVEFLNSEGVVTGDMLLAGMTRIPFIMMETTVSLMQDIADYQIALMNLESSDINYMMKSNFPIYTEQYDPRADMGYGYPQPDQVTDDPNAKKKEVVLGSGTGRRYPLGAQAPSFIHPSPEPVLASMQKEMDIKNDIRKLLNLSLSNLEPKFASAQSKGMDDRSLESGLSALGLVLQHGENQIAEVWAAYMKADVATVNYPRSYSLKSESERREEAKSDAELLSVVPSQLYHKAMAKKILRTMVAHLVSQEDLVTMEKEVDEAKYISSKAEDIAKDLEMGVVGGQTASVARGYSEGEYEVAKKDHAERLARIQKAQSPPGQGLDKPAARGVKEADPNPGSAKEEKNGAAGQ